MRSKFAAAGVSLALVILAATVASAAKPNFTGAWALDASKSEGVMPEAKETMTVKQDGDKFEIDRKMTTPRGERTSNDVFTADGKESDFVRRMGPNEAKGKRSAKWSADGSTLEIGEKLTFTTQQGEERTVESSSKWTLSADGKTLTVEQKGGFGPRGPQDSKRIYTKQ